MTLRVGDTVKYIGAKREYRGLVGTYAGVLRTKQDMGVMCVKNTNGLGCYDVSVPLSDLRLASTEVDVSVRMPGLRLASTEGRPAAGAARPPAAAQAFPEVILGEYLTPVYTCHGGAAPVTKVETESDGGTLVTVISDGIEISFQREEVYSDFQPGVTAALRANRSVVGEVILVDKQADEVGINVRGELRSFEAAELFVLAPAR